MDPGWKFPPKSARSTELPDRVVVVHWHQQRSSRPNVSVLDCSTCAYMDTMPCAALLQGVIFPYFSKGVYVAKIFFFNALDILLSILGCLLFVYFCSILL